MAITTPTQPTAPDDDHLTPGDRASLGKAAREDVPRTSHAAWLAGPERDPMSILCAQDDARVPELVPIRWGRMLASPFTFYRGAAALMAADLASTPASGLRVQACGDAHISNFGLFAAPDRSLVFDLNDFDETAPGPFEWDVKRMAASIEIAGRDRGEKRAARRKAVAASVRRYREAMRAFAGMTNLQVWYARLDSGAIAAELARGTDRRLQTNLDAALRKAEGKTSVRALTKLTEVVDGRLRFRSSPPLLVRLQDLLERDGADPRTEEQVVQVIRGYKGIANDQRHLFDSYRVVDIAHKVVGVGSVGTRAWVILLLGRDESDPLVLQAKEAGPSVLEAFTGRSRYRNHGQRVVEGQRLMQAASDMFLGWQRVMGLDGRERDFYVRQLWDGKGSADLSLMRPEGFARYVEACGWTLARAHARSGDRVAIASYLGGGKVFDDAIVEFAERYADENERDYATLRAAADDGRIPIESGV